MRNTRVWITVTIVLSTLLGAAMLVGNISLTKAAPEVVVKDHWRNHDGHWCYWHEADKRWYYTDGTHWFFEDGKAWHLYRFDKKFGHGEGFVHGTYTVPPVEVKIEVPKHGVFRP